MRALPFALLLAACTDKPTDTGQSVESYAITQAEALCGIYTDCDLYDTGEECSPTSGDLCYEGFDDCVEQVTDYNLGFIDDPSLCYAYSPIEAAACVEGIEALTCENWQSNWPAVCYEICG